LHYTTTPSVYRFYVFRNSYYPDIAKIPKKFQDLAAKYADQIRNCQSNKYAAKEKNKPEQG
jgi:hypothetical protein